ncbi:MAG TPA: Ig-like domain-containing protein [Candidatus Sulfotelmatobacter sp.]|nr:Ig-like domain-containing protein [Candidatus Sulfotelmatobacter sp.]
MSSKTPKVRLIGAFAVLATMALAASCRGFFVKPTLSSISVGPASPSIQTGSSNNTVQMFVVGTFNDGSTGNPPVSWSISPTTTATISPSGLVTSVATGTATVTASATQNPSITGTQTVTVTVGCIQTISVQPTSGTISNGGNTSVTLTAMANTCNGAVDVTSVAKWNSSNTTIATVSAGVVSPTGTAGADGTITITASSGGITSNPATITVSGY